MNDQIETLEHAMQCGHVALEVRYLGDRRCYVAWARCLREHVRRGALAHGDTMLDAMTNAFAKLYPEGNTER